MFKIKSHIFILLFALLLIPVKSLAVEAEAPRPAINDTYVVFLIIDGTNRDFFYEQLDSGAFPFLKSELVDKGAVFKDATTVYPSASTGAYQSFMTGLFPGEAGIPYLGWFDRTMSKPIEYLSASGYKHINHDFLNWRVLVDPDMPGFQNESTIFEKLRDEPSAAIYSEFYRGVKTQKPLIPIAGLWSTFISRRSGELDYYAWEDIYEQFDLPMERIPRMTLAGLYSSDEYGHEDGAKSEYVKLALQQTEGFLKKFVGQLKKRDIYEKTHIIVTADHGMHPIKGTFDLLEYLKKSGFDIVNQNSHAKNSNVYVCARGVSSAQIYIRGDGSWEKRPSFEAMRNLRAKNGTVLDIVESLRSQDAVDLVIVRNGHHRAEVFSKDGHGTIVWERIGKTDWYGYYPDPKTADPLKYSDNKELSSLIGGGMRGISAWGEPSAKMDYPDAVVQLSQIFRDGRAGDILVSSRDWSFSRTKEATHGSMTPGSMQFPILMKGPSVKKGEYGFIRSVDLYPTILDWFGIPHDDNHHAGVSMFDKKDQREDDGKRRLANTLACMDTNGAAPWCQKTAVSRSVAEARNALQTEEKVLAKLERIKTEIAAQINGTGPDTGMHKMVISANRWVVEQQIERVQGEISRLSGLVRR